MLCVGWGKDIPVVQNTSNTQLSARDEKSIPASKIYIFGDKTDSIPCLVSTKFQEIDFYPITVQKYWLSTPPQTDSSMSWDSCFRPVDRLP